MPGPDRTERAPLLIADGDIPTTRLVARELRVVHPEVEVRIPETLFGADVRRRTVVVSRLCHPSMRWLPGYFVEQGARYAYFLDDNFWELTKESDPYLAEHFRHPAVLATLDAFVRGARRVVVWSPRLGDYVRDRYPGSDVTFVAPGFDLSAVAKPLAAADGARRNDEFRVGYPTTRKVALTPLLHEIVERARAAFGDTVRFEFMGWMPDALGNASNAMLLPEVSDYASYLAFMITRGWDVAIAPLMPGRFESFKTDIKYREYAGCRIPGIYSHVPPYDESVQDGRTGILVANEAQAWIDAIDRLRSDRAIGRRIADAAFADIAERRDISITGRRLAEAIAS